MSREYKLPEVLREHMRKNKLSQRKFAKEIGISQRCIADWVTFKQTPCCFSLMTLADNMGVSIDYLIYGEK